MRYLPIFVSFAAATHLSADVRKWTSADGRVIEAEFVRPQGTSVVLKLKEGREVRVELAKLSQADQEFAKSQGPGTPPPATGALGKKASGFTDAVIDKKTWVMRPQPDTFGITGVVLAQQLETPHFIITSGAKIKPAVLDLYAEVCERLYAQVTGDFPGLETKFSGRRMTVWLSAGKPEHILLGKCLQDLGAGGGGWDDSSISSAYLPEELAESRKVQRRSRGFNLDYEPAGQRSLVWPERIHFLAATLISTYGHSEYKLHDHNFEMLNLSYSYFLENEISGRIETKVMFSSSMTNVEGFKNPKGWAAAVKRILGSTPLRPSLKRFMSLDAAEAEPIDVGGGFGLMQFIFRDPAKLAALNQLLETARKQQTPSSSAEFATAMGAASVEEFDQKWIDFMKSDQFK